MRRGGGGEEEEIDERRRSTHLAGDGGLLLFARRLDALLGDERLQDPRVRVLRRQAVKTNPRRL